MLTAVTLTASISSLSRRHRAWIALYSLDGRHHNRAEVLAANEITEEDLIEFEESWLALRCRPAAPTR